jgi:LacI family transcriptional regulator
MRRATAQDVADLAGVSRSSVSLVLNGHGEGNIAPAKQRLILDAAERLNYRPNAVALSLRSQHTRTIGVLTWPGAAGTSASLILSAALRTATEAGYLLIFMDTGGDEEVESRALTTLRDRQVEALLVIAPELTDYQPPEMMLSVPTILVNCADPQAGVTSVVPDEAGAGACAAQILVDAGHTRIGVIAGPAESVQTRLRVAGCRQVITTELAAPVQFVAGRDVASAAVAARTVLTQAEPPTALICAHERLAVGAALAAAQLQLDVPGDLSLVSLEDGEQLACQLNPAITTIERPDRAMAEQAVTMLLDRLTREAEFSVKQLAFVCPPAHRDSVVGPRLDVQPAKAASRR